MSKILREIYSISGIVAVAVILFIWLDAVAITREIFGEFPGAFAKTPAGRAWYFDLQRYIEKEQEIADNYHKRFQIGEPDPLVADPIVVFFNKIDNRYTPEIGEATLDSSSLVLVIHRNNIEVPENYVFRCGPGGSGADRSTEESLLHRKIYAKLSAECTRRPSRKATIAEVAEWANSMRASFYYSWVRVDNVHHVSISSDGGFFSSLDQWAKSWMLPYFVQNGLKLEENICDRQRECRRRVRNAKLFYEFPNEIPENVSGIIGDDKITYDDFGIWVQIDVPEDAGTAHLLLLPQSKNRLIAYLPYHHEVDLSESLSRLWVLSSNLELDLDRDLEKSSFLKMVFLNGIYHFSIEVGPARLSLVSALCIILFLAVVDLLLVLQKKYRAPRKLR